MTAKDYNPRLQLCNWNCGPLPREYRLLRYPADRPGSAASRAELLRAIWSLDFDPGTNVVEVHMSRLRARLDRGFAAPMLRTIKGCGYCLDAG